jgi:hypothetical protein
LARLIADPHVSGAVFAECMSVAGNTVGRNLDEFLFVRLQ